MCNQTFITEQNYFEHTRLHTGNRVKCDYCPKDYARTSGLYAHIEKYHSDVVVKRPSKSQKVIHLDAVPISISNTFEIPTTSNINSTSERSQSISPAQTNITHNGRVFSCLKCYKTFGNFDMYRAYNHSC